MTVSMHAKGSTFVRMAIAKAAGRGDVVAAAEVARARYGEASQPARLLKAAVSAGSTADGNWGGALAGEQVTSAAEFLALVRQRTIIGALGGLRRVPARTPLLVQETGGRAAWVKEGRPIPVTSMTMKRETMETLKIAAMMVVTEELVNSSDPAAENVVRDDLIRAIAEASDLAFIDPENAGIEGETPASVTHGVTAVVSTGNTKADINRLVAAFTGDLSAAYFVGRPDLFVQMNSVEFPNIGARGGEIAGIPAIASRSVPNDGDDYSLTLIDPTGIRYSADDAGTEIKISRQGSVQMNDDPDEMPTSTTTLVSMWQLNCVAIAALLRENWAVARNGAVARLTGITPTAPGA